MIEAYRLSTALDRSKLRVGAWYTIRYGFDRSDFCVIKISGDRVLLENPEWLLSSSCWMTKDEMFGAYHDAAFLEYGERRWFWGWVRKNTNCFGALYTRPSL